MDSTDPDGFDQMSISVELDEEKDILHSESASYPTSSMLSDIGGAAGLFLGLSVVGIVEYVCSFLRLVLKKTKLFVKPKQQTLTAIRYLPVDDDVLMTKL